MLGDAHFALVSMPHVVDWGVVVSLVVDFTGQARERSPEDVQRPCHRLETPKGEGLSG